MHFKGRWPIYVANFFFSLHYALNLYVNSSFLEKFFTPDAVSLLFVLGAFGSIVCFLLAPAFLRHLSVKRALIYNLIIEYAALAGLIMAPSAFIVGLSFIIYTSVILLTPLCLDIILEARTRENTTGAVRGANLSLGNFGILLAPLAVSILAFDSHFRLVYVASALALLPLFFISLCFRNVSSHFHKNYSLLALNLRAYSKDVRRVAWVRLILEFFYSIMAIYVPIYLYAVVGFSWHTIGLVFTVMLLPFVLLERPLGVLADNMWGEKEIMTMGLLVMAVSLITLPFLEGALAWALALFLSRVGASSVEIMSESYFFKHVSKDDTGLISLFRTTRPAGIIVGATAGALLLSCNTYSTLFYSLAIIVLGATLISSRIRDTR